MIRSVHIVVTAQHEQHFYFQRDAERLAAVLEHPDCGIDAHASPEQADAIVFVGSADPALVDVRNHPLFRKYRGKCFVFHSGDEPLPTVPGIYASIPRRWYDRRRHRAGFYLRATLDQSINDYSGLPADVPYTFIGAAGNHPVRARLLQLQGGWILDSGRAPVPPEQARARFVDSLQRSQFVLCPRGGGTSSFRIFETMQAGRVPVIISDAWVQPEGPDWDVFSVRVKESEIASIPSIITGLEHRAMEMGRSARAAWEAWFSPERAGITVLHWLQEIAQLRSGGKGADMPIAMRTRYALRQLRARLA